jgi:hypothetical protein
MTNALLLPDMVLGDVVDALHYSLNRVSEAEIGATSLAPDWQRVRSWLEETKGHLTPDGSTQRPTVPPLPISGERLRELQATIDAIVASRDAQQLAGKALPRSAPVQPHRPLGVQLIRSLRHAKLASMAVGVLAGVSLGLVVIALFSQGDTHTHVLYGSALAIGAAFGVELFNYSHLTRHGHLLHSVHTPFKHSDGRLTG